MELVIALLTYNLLLIMIVIFLPGKFINYTNGISVQMNKNEYFKWNITLYIVLISVILVAGMRESHVGTDYSGYLEFYNYILNHGYIGKSFKTNEYVWEYLNYSFAVIGIPSEIFFGLLAGLMYFFFIKGAYKFQFLLPLMFFFIFTSGFYFWTMSGLRQSIAIMIFFYAVKYIIEKKNLHYVLWIFVASGFHSSAIILLPLYFLNKIKFNQKLFFFLYIISILFIGNNWFLSKIDVLIQFVGSNIDAVSQYIKYLEAKAAISAESSRTGSGLGVIVKIAITFFIFYKSKYILEKHPEFNIYFILFSIGAIGSNLFYAVELIGRILIYFNIVFSIVIAIVIYYSNKSYEYIISIIFIIIYFIIFNKQLFSIFN